jgi:peptidylprolyl isomerase
VIAFLALVLAQDVDRVVFRTSLGDILVVLDRAAAPRHTERVLELAKAGVFDGVPFHRVLPGTLVQIEDHRARRLPLSTSQRALARPLPLELSGLQHRRGVLSLAHPDGEPDGGETSFSFLFGDAPHLDGRYTIFGRVERGMEVVEAIARLKSPDSERPLQRVEIERAFVPEVGAIPGFREAIPAPTFAVQRAAARFLLIAGTAVLAAGAGLAWAGGRARRPGLRAAGGMSILTGFFLVFGGSLQVFETGARPNGAVVLLFAAFAVFRLMAGFEKPRGQRAG